MASALVASCSCCCIALCGLGKFGIHNNYISEIKLQQIDLPVSSGMDWDPNLLLHRYSCPSLTTW